MERKLQLNEKITRTLCYLLAFLVVISFIDILIGASGLHKVFQKDDYAADENGHDRYVSSSFHYRNRDLYPHSTYSFDQDVGWIFKPGKFFKVKNPQLLLDYNITLNDAGYRYVPSSNKSSSIKVMVLGDGIAAGTGINDDRTFSNLIAEEGYLVDNFGMPGYGTDQEYSVFQKYRNRNYTHVLLFFYASNDFENVLQCKDKNCCLDKPIFLLEQNKAVRYGFDGLICNPSSGSRFYDIYLRASLNDLAINSNLNWLQFNLLYSLDVPKKIADLLHSDSNRVGNPAALTEIGFLDRNSEDGQKRIALVSYFVSEISRLSKNDGMKFYVYIVPSRAQICNNTTRNPGMPSSSLNASIEAIDDISKALNITVYDLTPYLKGRCYGDEAVYLERFDHLSQEGNKIVADAVLQTFLNP